VIFLTAYSGDEILERATLAEPYGYLLKPVQEQQLASAMRVATYKHKQDSGRREGVKSFSAILRALPNAVIVTDMSLTVRYLNRKAEDLLGIPNRSAVRRPVKDIVRLGGTTLDRDGVEAFVEVLSDGRTVTLGEQTVTIEGAAPVQVRIEISPLADREGVINGAIINMADLSGDSGVIKEGRFEDVPASLDSGPAVLDTGDLRSYLEVEIVRLTMDEGGSQSTQRGFREGQIMACKRILKYAFGDDALDDFQSILPNARQ
jgi:PAS domain-containing protein